MGSLKLIDITFHANTEYPDTDALIKAQQSSLNYVQAIKDKLQIEVIKHIGDHQTLIKEHTGFQFFYTKNFFFYIPFCTLRYLKTKATYKMPIFKNMQLVSKASTQKNGKSV